ncbi:MAG TPA: hypothetical protein DCL29_06915 [Eubacterium sp.]|nr:hypothetical protein [Eubacterium sp.]
MIRKRKRLVHKFLLDTKAKIPFPQAQLTIYQPSVAELSLMGEPNFLIATNALTKDYKSLNIEDNFNLENLTNFDILMSMIKEKSEQSKIIFLSILQLFDLIFPDYKVGIIPNGFLLQEKNTDVEQKTIHHIDSANFDEFAQIIYEMFGLASFQGVTGDDYNPQGDRARALVEKFRQKREFLMKLRQEKGEDTELNSVFGRYIDILAVGECKDKNLLAQYSLYQLIEEFKRFELKEAFDYTLRAKMAGATKVKDAKDWYQDITLGVDLKEE